MSAPDWMPLYIADYLGDTARLSTLEHGAYMLLIMDYWRNGGLPTEDFRLARITRLSLEEWMAIRPAIAEFFDDGWRHGRIDDELGKAREVMARQSKAGRAAANARWGKRNAIASTDAQQSHTHLPLPEPEPIAAQQVISESGKAEPDDICSRLAEAAGGRVESADTSTILALIDKGYDLAKDILPVIRARAAKATKPIGSWRYFVPAIEEARAANGAIKPNGTGGTRGAPMTWVCDDSPQWSAVAKRYAREKQTPLMARGSIHATGLGAYVPSAWLTGDAVCEPGGLPP